MHPKYLRAKGIAKFFGIPLSTFWLFTHRPGFPQPLRPSSRLTLFDVTAVENWLKDQSFVDGEGRL